MNNFCYKRLIFFLYFINEWFCYNIVLLIRYVVKIAYQSQSKGGNKFSNPQTTLTALNFAPLPLLNKQDVTSPCRRSV